MRPRHKAAENDGAAQREAAPPVAASMRPRHKAAENGGLAYAVCAMLMLLQ